MQPLGGLAVYTGDQVDKIRYRVGEVTFFKYPSMHMKYTGNRVVKFEPNSNWIPHPENVFSLIRKTKSVFLSVSWAG